MNDLCPCAGSSGAESPQAALCTLSKVKAGLSVRIKRLSAPPEMSHRLREMGLFEEQKIRVVAKNGNLICQVCNSRLGISPKIADLILVEPIASHRKASSNTARL